MKYSIPLLGFQRPRQGVVGPRIVRRFPHWTTRLVATVVIVSSTSWDDSFVSRSAGVSAILAVRVRFSIVHSISAEESSDGGCP